MLRALLIHAWRRVVLHDPQLPAAMLPTPWAGQTARALCERLYWKIFAASEIYLEQQLAPDNPQHALLAQSVFMRFGGAPAAVIAASQDLSSRSVCSRIDLAEIKH